MNDSNIMTYFGSIVNIDFVNPFVFYILSANQAAFQAEQALDMRAESLVVQQRGIGLQNACGILGGIL